MKILIAYDGTDGAREALIVGQQIANEAHGDLVVCWVLNPRVDAADIVAATTAAAMTQVEERARSTIEQALAEVGATAAVRIESVDRGEDVGERLAKVATEEAVTLLAIASRRAGGLRGLMGSVAQEVLRLSPCPVVVVRPDPRN